MIVYGTSVSPFVRKVLVFIAEKGLQAEHLPIGLQDSLAEFRACSPAGKIPALRDDSFRLADSSAICHYLERKHPAPALFPSGAEDYGRMVWFDEYADTIAWAAGAKAFFNLVVMPKVLGKPGDSAAAAKALNEELPPIFDYLESQVTGPFLVGGAFSLADIAVTSPFVNLKIAGHPLDASRWPKLAGYISAIVARPSFAAARDRKQAA
jgi:glutathione S-transferase